METRKVHSNQTDAAGPSRFTYHQTDRHNRQRFHFTTVSYHSKASSSPCGGKYQHRTELPLDMVNPFQCWLSSNDVCLLTIVSMHFL